MTEFIHSEGDPQRVLGVMAARVMESLEDEGIRLAGAVMVAELHDPDGEVSITVYSTSKSPVYRQAILEAGVNLLDCPGELEGWNLDDDGDEAGESD